MLVIALASLALAAPGDAETDPSADPAADEGAPGGNAADEGGSPGDATPSADPGAAAGAPAGAPAGDAPPSEAPAAPTTSAAGFDASPPPAPDAAGDTPGPLARSRATPEEVRLVVRGLGELWHDPWIGGRFKPGGFGAGLGLVVPFGGFFAVDAEIGYGRLQAGDSEGTFQFVPVSILAEVRWTPAGEDTLEVFGGAGPAITMWSESGQDPSWTGTLEEGQEVGPTLLRGARPGVELRVGTRIDLGLTQPSLAPAPPSTLRGVDLEVFIGRRLMPSSSGFNLNAWRASAGVALRF